MASDDKETKIYESGLAAVSKLDPIQQAIIRKLFGLSESNAESPEQVAAEFDIEVKDVRDLEAQALRNLRGTKPRVAVDGAVIDLIKKNGSANGHGNGNGNHLSNGVKITRVK